ncbi:DNA polymerase III subunit gamma/tau [Pseudomonas matsuisoli]|uniref:DNA polymerase III subunit gamma/tau n=1 Tax=Pseudomonas matsuisoli TaxID=1515666 RepID=A0A917V0F5_9PSED|nr:DNA polymerase III subunit gamma/tau [Pseudomonas matsuisoli]GGK06942.1 DNA polymerase III subunit gamma/tau [Pseudomonas matsuisoli]
MSYQVLARKWRPRSFREMVGQTHVLKALINALDNQRLHHAYLFTGTRGVGKTTIARILAKCLNCETGISSTPCGQCSVCREIDEGRFVDLIEVDAASRTKVEDTRELLDNVQYAPTRGRYKVYLIDEVHMLSTHSFNALLKTLEEPPPHVKFLLATTDPQKLPVTILSRCLQFSLKNMPPERVVEHLTHVLTAESVPFEDDALWLLGRAADGSMRDAMSLTDQAISFGEGRVVAADVRAMLGTLDHGQVYGVLQALLEGDARELLGAVRHLAEQGPDWAGVLGEMLNVLHRVAVAQALPEAVDNGQGDRDKVLALAQALPAEDVQFYYQMGLIGRRDLPLAPDPRSGFEMVVLRMLAFRPADAEGGGSGRPLKDLGISKAATDSKVVAAAGDPASTTAPTQKTSPSITSVASAPVTSPQPALPVAPSPAPAAEVEPVKPTTQDSPPWDVPSADATANDGGTGDALIDAVDAAESAISEPDDTVMSDESLVAEAMSTVDPQLMDAPVPPESDDYSDDRDDDVDADVYAYMEGYAVADMVSPEPEPEPTPGDDALRPDIPPATGLAARWLEVFPQLKLAGLTGSIAANCTLAREEEDTWYLYLDPGHSALYNATQQRRLNDAVNAFTGRSIKVDVTIQAPGHETPALAAARKRAARQRDAERSIEDDPLVRKMIEQFAATVRADTIEPLEN